MRFPRSSGILLHITSLPGPTGIGDMGPGARAFVDFLASAGQSLWQILPLGPTGYGNSPYGSWSAFAGNPNFISLESLVEDGLLEPSELEVFRTLPTDKVDFASLEPLRDGLLRKAFARFSAQAGPRMRHAFRSYCEMPQVKGWLEDVALFAALKRAHENRPWTEWEPPLVMREPHALRLVRERLADELWYQRFLQWVFDTQWAALRRYAHSKGVEIVGDIPIYVADDSVDVWANPELFYLDGQGLRTVVAGVPPDYFSKTGQLWGNPLYRWDRMRDTGFSWWIHRFEVLFLRCDRLRVDHFRGFEAYWEVPSHEKTAIHGRWVPGPGERLFQAVERRLGNLPIIAEDLGIITPEVEALRDACGFPGMKILQFAFGSGAKNPYLPHNYTPSSVVYTGTHDNDTTPGWLASLDAEGLAAVQTYLGAPTRTGAASAADVSGGDVARKGGVELLWPIIRLAQSSVADTCILPLQDVLELGTEARMNVPAEKDGNWEWRVALDALTPALAEKLLALAVTYNRAIAPETPRVARAVLQPSDSSEAGAE